MIVDIQSGCVLSIAIIFLVCVWRKKGRGERDQYPNPLKVTADYL